MPSMEEIEMENTAALDRVCLVLEYFRAMEWDIPEVG